MRPGYLALTVPGLGGVLAGEIQDSTGLRLSGEVGNDGRADVVSFDVGRGADPVGGLRTAEDVFAVVARARSDGDPQRLVSRLITRDGLERALSVWSRWVGPLSASATFRVIVRVLSERQFRRTSLRSVALAAVARQRPRWRVEDPSMLELWILETKPSEFVAALRLSSRALRQRGGRAQERRAALRPAVASAMVRLAGQPNGRLLDPCCGSGTIVGEALDRGWQALGSDIDPEALAIAEQNCPEAEFRQADVRELPYPRGWADAIVTNPPFGNQFECRVAARSG